jgi:hypothetical protein
LAGSILAGCITIVATNTSNLKAADVKVRVFVPVLVKVMLNLLQAVGRVVCRKTHMSG